MFARYDYSEFPEVRVFFTGSINTEEDFTLFTEQWIKLYDDKKDFSFIFDMENIGFIHPTYCYKMAQFISELKKRDKHYLTKSKIINVNSFMMYLLYITFQIQAPVAPVYIHSQESIVTLIP